MAKVERKTWPEAFEKILSGDKTYDIRLADWKIEPGDILVLREYDPKTETFSGRVIEKKVGYVGKTKDWEVWPKDQIEKHGFQVISLLDK